MSSLPRGVTSAAMVLGVDGLGGRRLGLIGLARQESVRQGESTALTVHANLKQLDFGISRSSLDAKDRIIASQEDRQGLGVSPGSGRRGGLGRYGNTLLQNVAMACKRARTSDSPPMAKTAQAPAYKGPYLT
jgi:hypothetical protein